MNLERWQTPIVLTLLAVVALGSWALRMRPGMQVEAETLSALPLEIGGWRGHEIPMQGDVEAMLDADYNVQRAYVHPAAGFVWLYVGYYGTERGGRPEHTPWACYPSNGWTIELSDVVRVSGPGGREANELVVSKDGERRLIHFWYQSFRRNGLLGGLDQTLDRLANRVLNGRADGSLVRLSTPIRSDEVLETARSRLIGFGREVEPGLDRHWPSEVVVAAQP
jgi:EpsI family protein